MANSTAEQAQWPGSEPARPLGCAGHRTQIRRHPEESVLHQVVREHLETFLLEAHLRGGGEGLPRFVERELREFLTCGVTRNANGKQGTGNRKRETTNTWG